MPISSGEILFKLATAIGPGNSHTGTVYESLGGFVSTTVLDTNVLDNLFNDIDADENADEQVDYQCIFVHNSDASLTLIGAVAYLDSQVSGGANIAIASDNVGATALADASAQSTTISTPTDVPTDVGVFSSPTDQPDGISLGDIGPGQVVALWVQRSATDSIAVTGDGVSITVAGVTTA